GLVGRDGEQRSRFGCEAGAVAARGEEVEQLEASREQSRRETDRLFELRLALRSAAVGEQPAGEEGMRRRLVRPESPRAAEQGLGLARVAERVAQDGAVDLERRVIGRERRR